MVKKHLTLEQKKHLRDQIDNFESELFGAGEKLSILRFQEEHYMKYIKIQIKQSLKKIERLESNVKVLQCQIRDGIEVPKTMAEDEETTEEESEEEEKTEEKKEE